MTPSQATDELLSSIRQLPLEHQADATVDAIVRLTNRLCHLSAGNDLVAEVLDGEFKNLDHRFGVIHCNSLEELLGEDLSNNVTRNISMTPRSQQ
jgi:hypothetical protein